MATNAITMTIWNKTLDSYRDWSAFHWLLVKLGVLRGILRIVVLFLSCGTVGSLLAGWSHDTQVILALTTAGMTAVLEVWLTERYLDHLREAAAFEAQAYDAWFALWRRLDQVTLEEIESLIISQRGGAEKYGGRAPALLVWCMARRASRTIEPMLNASMEPA